MTESETQQLVYRACCEFVDLTGYMFVYITGEDDNVVVGLIISCAPGTSHLNATYMNVLWSDIEYDIHDITYVTCRNIKLLFKPE